LPPGSTTLEMTLHSILEPLPTDPRVHCLPANDRGQDPALAGHPSPSHQGPGCSWETPEESVSPETDSPEQKSSQLARGSRASPEPPPHCPRYPVGTSSKPLMRTSAASFYMGSVWHWREKMSTAPASSPCPGWRLGTRWGRGAEAAGGPRTPSPFAVPPSGRLQGSQCGA
jgi:hypothetical protein